MPSSEADGTGPGPGEPTVRDYISIGLVSLIAFLSGYLVTGCFQLAPQLLLLPRQEEQEERQPLSSPFASTAAAEVTSGVDEFKDEIVTELAKSATPPDQL